MRTRVIACLVVTFSGIALLNGTVHAEGTRSQHLEWMRKLETPGGPFAHFLDMPDDAKSSLLMPDGTVPQHRSWMGKLETPGGTLGSPL
jgi:hypothetical protein